MKIIATDRAPAAIGAYSQATVHQGVVYASGQIALSPDGTWAGGDVSAQTEQVLTNLAAVLEAAGSSLNDVLKATIFLEDMADFSAVNAVYAQAFSEHRPARECVAARALPRGAAVEISCIARVSEPCC
ncbi:MAG: Rid family detoxifying hydrolase [Myxococcota bacterium]|nr:Rid family detoxifying hydrolase [Myxococcota bacterium]